VSKLIEFYCELSTQYRPMSFQSRIYRLILTKAKSTQENYTVQLRTTQ